MRRFLITMLAIGAANVAAAASFNGFAIDYEALSKEDLNDPNTPFTVLDAETKTVDTTNTPIPVEFDTPVMAGPMQGFLVQVDLYGEIVEWSANNTIPVEMLPGDDFFGFSLADSDADSQNLKGFASVTVISDNLVGDVDITVSRDEILFNLANLTEVGVDGDVGLGGGFFKAKVAFVPVPAAAPMAFAAFAALGIAARRRRRA